MVHSENSLYPEPVSGIFSGKNFLKIFGFVKNLFFEDMVTPLAPSLPRRGRGACDASVLQKPLSHFLLTGNTALSQPGRHERAGRSPRSVKQLPMISIEQNFPKIPGQPQKIV
jgi:hypothetical protein